MANEHMSWMLDDAARVQKGIDETAATYTDAEMRMLRTGAGYSNAMIEKIDKSILYIAALLFRDHPRVQKWPNATDLPNTFIYRAALCVYLLTLDWISHGGAAGAAPVKIRNDMIDVSFAAYATFFDGLLSADRKVVRIYEQATRFLVAMFPPPSR